MLKTLKLKIKPLLKNERLLDFLDGLKCAGEDISLVFWAKTFNTTIPKARMMMNRWSDCGYFEISKRNNKKFFKLTPRGLNFIELLRFGAGKMNWDKRWRILIFDIPEKQRRKRDALRQKLNELNFYQLQKSVWITPFPLPAEFTDFLTKKRVHRFLFSITADGINRENELKSFFGLDKKITESSRS